MSARIPRFEAIVLVKNNTSKIYNSFLGLWCEEEEKMMYHIDARTRKQAREKAKKYGRPLIIRKYHAIDRLKNIEHIKLDQQPIGIYQLGNPYKDAIAMDEMIWRKRNLRRANINRDKQKYFLEKP